MQWSITRKSQCAGFEISAKFKGQTCAQSNGPAVACWGGPCRKVSAARVAPGSAPQCGGFGCRAARRRAAQRRPAPAGLRTLVCPALTGHAASPATAVLRSASARAWRLSVPPRPTACVPAPGPASSKSTWHRAGAVAGGIGAGLLSLQNLIFCSGQDGYDGLPGPPKQAPGLPGVLPPGQAGPHKGAGVRRFGVRGPVVPPAPLLGQLPPPPPLPPPPMLPPMRRSLSDDALDTSAMMGNMSVALRRMSAGGGGGMPDMHW